MFSKTKYFSKKGSTVLHDKKNLFNVWFNKERLDS